MALTKEDQTIQVTGTIDTTGTARLPWKQVRCGWMISRSLAAHLLPLTGLKGQVTDTSITWTGTEDGNHSSGKSAPGIGAGYLYL